MKIDNSLKPLGGVASGARKGVAKPETGSGPAAPSSQVGLSPMSTRLQEIESELANTPTMNSERVAEIRQAIAQGNFKIDASKIADGLVDSVRQMLLAGQK